MNDLSMIDMRVECEGWRDLGDPEAFAKRCYDAVAAELPVCDKPVCILLTDDDRVRKLNNNFLGKDRPTNVLSFPANDPAGPDQDYLGDIAMAYETCAQEADLTGTPIASHSAHLLVHGMLHLLGYDHERDADADIMEAMEIRILSRLGVRDPYLEETN